MEREKAENDRKFNVRETQARLKIEEHTQKITEFEHRKKREMEIQRSVMEEGLLASERKIREENSVEEVDQLVREMQATADADVKKMQSKHEKELANRIKQADAIVETVNKQLSKDMAKLEQENAAQHSALQETLTQREASLRKKREETRQTQDRIQGELKLQNVLNWLNFVTEKTKWKW